jgi:transposase
MIDDRDINASKNILKRATVGLTGSYACGDISSTPLATKEQDISKKQELYRVRT